MAHSIIRQVDANSPAAGRVRPGEALLSVNGKLIRDVLDYKFHTYDRDLLLELKTPEGKLRLVRVRKAAGQDLYVGKSTKNGKPIFDTCHPSKAGAKRYGEAFIKDATTRKLPIASIFK